MAVNRVSYGSLYLRLYLQSNANDTDLRTSKQQSLSPGLQKLQLRIVWDSIHQAEELNDDC